MTTYIESVVDTGATLDEADALVKIVVSNLCEQGIILPTPQTHEYLGDGSRYSTGPNAHLAAGNINHCFPCGMDVSIGRNVFDTGELVFNLLCPTCKHRFDTDALDWADPLSQWYESGNVGNLLCSECSTPTPFTGWFQPSFGFGNLAFRFSEWFLKPGFVEQISELLQHRVAWVKAQY